MHLESADALGICLGKLQQSARVGGDSGPDCPSSPTTTASRIFWAHLEKDFELLGRDTGRGLDETVMIAHLVLRQILITNPPTAG